MREADVHAVAKRLSPAAVADALNEVPAPHLFRRLFHLISPIFLGYYVVPGQFPNGVTRESLLILFFGTAMAIEVARIALRIPIFGMRGYEAERLSAYAWGTIGLVIGFLFFDPVLVIPVFCGMAWIDPLCAWSAKANVYPWVPAIAYATVFAGWLVLLRPLHSLDFLEIAALTAIALPVALLAEYPNFRWIDDDFLMTIAPLLVLTPALIAFSALP